MVHSYSNIKFQATESGFKHHFNEDFSLFAIWKTARPFIDTIVDTLNERFEIVLQTEIIWSEKYFHENANRLYEAPLYYSTLDKTDVSSYADKIGGNSFILIVIKDKNPNYTYSNSVSGKIELTNLNIQESKNNLRKIIELKTGEKYGVHSANNIYEFFYQGSLILGLDLFYEVLKGEKMTLPVLEKDLEGAGGWKDYKSFFSILNVGCNYIVLRSFENLIELNKNEDKDIDFLTDNFQRLASVGGIIQKRYQPYKGYVYIGGEKISIDIRFIGDNYYDPAWQKDIMNNKIFNNGLYSPSDSDYFFSLFYHAKVQKPTVKAKYYTILENLSLKLQFLWFNKSMLDDDISSAKLLKGFLEGSNYSYKDPLDKHVYENKIITKHLPQDNVYILKGTPLQKTKDFLKRVLPRKIVDRIQEVRRNKREKITAN